MEKVEKSFRHRINTTVTTKGLETWDCTVEGTGFTREEIQAESEALVAYLRSQYPVPKVV
jgi:hypothetical protein